MRIYNIQSRYKSNSDWIMSKVLVGLNICNSLSKFSVKYGIFSILYIIFPQFNKQYHLLN